MVTINNISKAFGSRVILDSVSFGISQGQKVALIGSNGSGKTTLLKIMAGLENPDSGSVSIKDDMLIGYLRQDTSLVPDESVIGYLGRTTGIESIRAEMERLEQDLTDPKRLSRYGDLQETFTRLGGYALKQRAEAMLNGFGLEKLQLAQRMKTLSSGQKTKVALVGILLKGVDLLLLDEPTNNLDLPALIWLETYLRQSSATTIIVSHDRALLDKIASRIIELDWRTHDITIRNGSYSDFLIQKEKDKESQRQAYKHQQEEVARLSSEIRTKKQEALRGGGYVGTDNDKFARGAKRDRAAGSARVAKALEKRIDQMTKVERLIERPPLRITLEAEGLKGKPEVELIKVVAGYDDFEIGPISLQVPFGQRIAILGLNGSGKSTLLKVLSGSLKPKSGTVRRSPTLHIGNLMQEHDSLPRGQTLYDFLATKAKLASPEIHNTLVKFGFSRDHVHDKIGTISPGARARLLLAMFAHRSVNTLILDEPTNHLDLEALEALEEVLANYGGTVIAVTHDRYFLQHAHFDQLHLLQDGQLVALDSLEDYTRQAEQRAKKIIRTF